MAVRDMDKYAAMRPYFEVVAEGWRVWSTGPTSSISMPRMWWWSTSSLSRSTPHHRWARSAG